MARAYICCFKSAVALHLSQCPYQLPLLHDLTVDALLLLCKKIVDKEAIPLLFPLIP